MAERQPPPGGGTTPGGLSLGDAVRLARRTLRPARALARRAKREAGGAKLLVRPLRPPVVGPALVAEYSRVHADERFITGNGFAARCRHVLNYDRLTVNEHVENDWWFCNADFLRYFFREVAPESPFVLISHNSDRAIGRRFIRELRRRNLIAWFAANVAVAHPKLFAIPLGFANPIWPHGDAGALEAVQRAGIAKTHLFDVSFSVHTNPKERAHCLAETQLTLQPACSFPEYLERLAAAYFCICPSGAGGDTLRMWEALYLRTIPVLTRSTLTDQHSDLPMIVLDDWSGFDSIDFGPEVYTRVMGDWQPEELSVGRYLRRISAIVDGIRAGRELEPRRASSP